MKIKDKNKKQMISISSKITKGEIGIYVIALMLVAAGYLNYTASDTQETIAESTYSENTQWIEEAQMSQENNIGDATLVSNNEIDENKQHFTLDVSENTISNDESITNQENSNTNNTIGESVQTSISSNNDYFASSKLERDTMYSQMISTYEQIVENSNVSETQKSIASEEISKINNTRNAIMICENLLNVKGFNNCVIFVNNNSVNVVLDSKDLSKDQVAQIQNVISREIKSSIEDIHIMSK